MKRLIRTLLTVMICGASTFALQANAQPFQPPFTQDSVLAYLEQIITLQQRINVLAAGAGSARETILAETLRQNAARVSQHGFAFARTQATLLDGQASETPAETPDGAAQQSELDKFTVTVTQRIANLQKDFAMLNARIARTPSRQRSPLLSRRETLTGELNLAKAQMELIGSINDTVTKTGETDTTSGLLKKINNLSRSMTSLSPLINEEKDADGNPVVRPLTPLKETANDNPATAEKPDSRGGLFSSGAELFALWQKQNQLRSLKQDINDLRTVTKNLRAQLRETLQSMAKSGNTLAQADTQARSLADQRQDFDTLVDNFKLLSASVVPLSQAAVALDNAKQSFKDWQILTDNQLHATARDFLWHLALLAIAIAIPLALSEIARRTTTLYVKDERRSRQLRLLRRVVFGVIIVLIVMLNLASELGSLATYAGLLTAGIAVALQNVILSLAAHFFFFGRYGIRAGDRVTVGGVTGDVTQIGMVRLYLMEIEGSGDETRPSGRIVAFPNSILFQPTAFFKHMPA